MTVHRFETVLGAEGSRVFIEIPLDVPALFGRARPAVRVTVNGHPFRSTVAVYGGRYYLPVKRACGRPPGTRRPAPPSPACPTPTSGSTWSEWRRRSATRPGAAAWSRPWPCSATAAGTPEGQFGAESGRA